MIARTIARALNLNEDLTEATALGHDLGHTPFGHNGEEVLNKIHPGGVKHNVQSLRVADVIESTQSRRGMNLTMEVRDGIVNHTGSGIPFTLEGQIVKLSDRIAYINHDIDDAMRAGILTNDDIPREISDVLGETHRERINTLVTDMIFHSRGTGELGMTPEIEQTMQALRQFMFERVYKNPVAKGEESKARRILQELYTYYIAHPEALPQDFQPQLTFEVSAAAVIACALYELSMYDKDNAVQYKEWADTIVSNLSKNYRAALNGDRGFLLLHSTGSAPHKSES